MQNKTLRSFKLCTFTMPLYQQHNLEAKLKALADDLPNGAQMLLLDKLENIVEKAENTVCQHFIIPKCFQKFPV